ncbi:hypothetical protein C7H84_34915 [Burkholderia sp. Nafp2/4-1b]|nr:hypothetical protein C7H84_34915 [Burkholderia sp. Nafp2/4-1b]
MDATLIHAPSSTKNGNGQRDPEMSHTKKRNQWYFGMEAHIGMDLTSRIVHHRDDDGEVDDKRCFDESVPDYQAAIQLSKTRCATRVAIRRDVIRQRGKMMYVYVIM